MNIGVLLYLTTGRLLLIKMQLILYMLVIPLSSNPSVSRSRHMNHGDKPPNQHGSNT